MIETDSQTTTKSIAPAIMIRNYLLLPKFIGASWNIGFADLEMLHGSGRAFGTDEVVRSDQEKYRRVYKNMAPCGNG